MEVRAAELREANAATLMFEVEMDYTVNIALGLPLIRRDHQSSATLRSETKEGLNHTAIMEWVARELTKLAKAVYKYALGIRVFDCIRDFTT